MHPMRLLMGCFYEVLQFDYFIVDFGAFEN